MPKNAQKNAYQNQKYSLPSMEDAILNYAYAFSYNPQFQPSDYQGDFEKWYNSIIKILCKMKGCEISFSVELSKLGRLHFHGTLIMTTLWKFYYYDVKLLMNEGTFEIDTIKSIDEWQAYVDKNKIEMSTMMEAYGLPRTLQTKRTVKPNPETKQQCKLFFKEDYPNSDSETDSEFDDT